MGVTDREKIVDAPLMERGEVGRPGKKVPRGFPRVITIADAAEVPSDRSGRLELSRWLTHSDHPLTARVMANRVWRHLFGAGLVRTVDNFGFSGERPSHPELLDTLAVRFAADGWSVKRLVQEIVLSRTYRRLRLSRRCIPCRSGKPALCDAKRRLDAEAIRDAMLVVFGELDTTRRIGSLVGKEIGDRPIRSSAWIPRLPSTSTGRVTDRSIYAIRDRLPDILDLFVRRPAWAPGRVRRMSPSIPFVTAFAIAGRALADRLMREADDKASRIHQAFLLCFSHAPAPDELKVAASFFAQGGHRRGR
ncbi:MAG: DUF1553 domain-containing protein [Singulisphaera sp.]